MDLTQCIESEKIVKSGKIRFHPLGHYFALPQHLNLNGATTLHALTEQMQLEIKSHHWDPIKNEEQICKRTVQLIHSNEYFGPYGQGFVGPEGNKAKYLWQGFENNYLKTNLKDFKKGELICKQEAAVASYVLDKCGISNYYCAGPTESGSGHAYVQTKTGNIVEATNPSNPYKKSVNHGIIANGQIAIVRFLCDNEVAYQAYGSGNVGSTKALEFTLSFNKAEFLHKTVSTNSSHAFDKVAAALISQSADDLKNSGVSLHYDGKDSAAMPNLNKSITQKVIRL